MNYYILLISLHPVPHYINKSFYKLPQLILQCFRQCCTFVRLLYKAKKVTGKVTGYCRESVNTLMGKSFSFK